MGKRQTRIFSKDLVNKFSSFAGLEVNIVLKNKTVLHGKPLQIDQQALIINNLRSKKHKLLLSEIEEIIVDKETMY